MIIFEPPVPVPGAPNLNKGRKVFNLCYDSMEDYKADLVQEGTQFFSKTIDLLDRVHADDYVQDVLSGARPNGYGGADDQETEHALTSCVVMVRATREALARKCPVFAPVSGFHHAGYNFSGGFCTFNGLVAAAQLARDGGANKVLIIDGDGHHGDGTVDLLGRNGRSYWLTNCDLSYSNTAGDPDIANAHLFESLEQGPWDLILYQAGADSHKDDPYGAGYLTDERWDMRDAVVFNYCRTTRTPLVFCLAGGYNGAKTLTLHNRTFLSALQVYEPESTRLVSAPTLDTSTAGIQYPAPSPPASGYPE